MNLRLFSQTAVSSGRAVNKKWGVTYRKLASQPGSWVGAHLGAFVEEAEGM